MRSKLRIAAATFALSLAACSSAPPSPVAKLVESLPAETSALTPDAERMPAPEFNTKDANGAPVNVAAYKGKVLLLNFWATWCIPCKAEMPWFQEFERSYKDRGFAVLGASLDANGWDVVKPYVDEHKINYRIILAGPEMTQLYQVVDALPMTFMIDQLGRIAAIHHGLVSKATYAKQIDQLLENTPCCATRY